MIDGISIHHDDFATVCRIDSFSDELKNEIRGRLTTICHGPDAVEGDRVYASYKNTLREFIKRYKKKTEKIKKGMIGELLTHILLLKTHPHFEPANPFFNMEEGSIKKGFDLVIFDSKLDQLWISEVKAGNAGSNAANKFNKILLDRAKNDLNGRLNDNETNIWHNAINGAKVALIGGKIKDRIGEILDACYEEASSDQQDATSKNVIIISVTYKNTNDQVTIEEVKGKGDKIDQEKLFKQIIVFSIQKETYERVAEYLEEEASS